MQYDVEDDDLDDESLAIIEELVDEFYYATHDYKPEIIALAAIEILEGVLCENTNTELEVNIFLSALNQRLLSSFRQVKRERTLQ